MKRHLEEVVGTKGWVSPLHSGCWLQHSSKKQEKLVERKYFITIFITSFSVANGSNLSNKLMFDKRKPLSTPPSKKMIYFMSNGQCLNFFRIYVESNQESNIRSSVKDTQAHFDNIYLIFFCDVLDEYFHSEGIIECF